MSVSVHPGLRLQRFTQEFAPAVASWVPLPDELFHLAPQTPPPLTPDKVISWTRGDVNAYLLRSAELCPLAYGELNPMPREAAHLWIGHFIVAPEHRRQGLGEAFLRLLLDEAFVARGTAAVSLVVFPDNEAAIRCYRKVGFQDVGAQPRFFPVTGRRHALRHYRIARSAYLPDQG